VEVGSECTLKLVITPPFLLSVYELGAEYGRKIVNAIQTFLRNPDHNCLHHERLTGKAVGLQSIHVDDSCRIVFSGKQVLMLLYAGSDDQISHFAERAGAEATAMAESPIAHQLHSCADPLQVFAPAHASESPSCGAPVSADGLARLIVGTRKYLPLTHLLLSRGPEVGSMEVGLRALETALGDALPKSAHTSRRWWDNDPARTQAYSWMAVGWKTAAVDLHNETVTFIRGEPLLT